MAFPLCEYYQRGKLRPHETHIENIELIRKSCTNLTTLELSLRNKADYIVKDSSQATEALNLLEAQLKTIPSLKKVIVNVKVYGEEAVGEDVMERIHDQGWGVGVLRMEIPRVETPKIKMPKMRIVERKIPKITLDEPEDEDESCFEYAHCLSTVLDRKWNDYHDWQREPYWDKDPECA